MLSTLPEGSCPSSTLVSSCPTAVCWPTVPLFSSRKLLKLNVVGRCPDGRCNPIAFVFFPYGVARCTTPEEDPDARDGAGPYG